jgi:presenilin-like A22 family membrane protease
MLLRERWKDKPSRDFISVGMGSLMMGFLLSAAGSHWFDATPMLSGFLLGLAGVLIGLSLVMDIQGLKRYRAEQARR